MFTFTDWSIILAYLFFSLLLAFCVKKVSEKSLTDYFLSGRMLPWWLVGSSMVATTFAADTPLWVTGRVWEYGIAGNWLWWSMAIGGLFTVFFFAHLWRRAGVLTDLEFIELRYTGKIAVFLRTFKAVYFGLFLNCIIMAWIHLALIKVFQVIFPDWNPYLITALLAFFTIFYVCLSGLWGVILTDLFQFAIALVGCILLAYFAIKHSSIVNGGGLNNLLSDEMLRFVPSFGAETSNTIPAIASEAKAFTPTKNLSVTAFLAYILIQWWAAWYPGAEPGGGGYIAQRLMSAKSERDAKLAGLWFVIAHYCIRSWPWIIAALGVVVLYPELQTQSVGEVEKSYIFLIRDILPSPWKGLLLAAFMGAYMSTLSTHLNWGSSYLINDFYLRLRKSKKISHILEARLCTIFLGIISLLVSFYLLDSIGQAWTFLIDCTAGMGFILILRWYWWRVNATAELASMIVPLVIVSIIRFIIPYFFPHWEIPPNPESLFITVPIVVSLTLIIMWMTKPEPRALLENFYKRVRPVGPGWRPISNTSLKGLGSQTLYWLISIVLLYLFLFAIGYIILAR